MLSLMHQAPSPPHHLLPNPFQPSIPTKTHLRNLDRLLRKQPPPPPPHTNPNPKNPTTPKPPFLKTLTLPFKRSDDESMSPRTLTNLHRLLSGSSGPSPRNQISSSWRQLHGENDWRGLLDPLDPDLRREVIRYGELVQSAYHAFHSVDPSVPPSAPRPVPLPDRTYRVVRHLFATSSLTLPSWIPGTDQGPSSWIGFVAVCDSDREIARLGRRDIVVSLRGTATTYEWAENLRADLVQADPGGNKTEKVERGFYSLFKTAGSGIDSLASAVVNTAQGLIQQYKDEELSITVTGHSLGAALAVLVAEELSARIPRAPPVAVFSFGGPRVGNQAFADRVERRKVKVLRVVNAHDVITRVPPHARNGYAHVGRELRVDSRISPYLRPDADPACCHDLEAYLHLVDGFMGEKCPFRPNSKRSLVRLLKHQGSNLKQKYVSKARDLILDPARPNVRIQQNTVI